MSFNQFNLDRSHNSTRIYDKFVYLTEDTIADVSTAGYFAASRFVGLPDWPGSLIDIQASDGYVLGQVNVNNGVDVLLNSTLAATSMPIAPLGSAFQGEGDTWIDTRVYSANSLWLWDTDTTATDPGIGNIKANNADLSLATEIYISDSRLNTYDASTVLANFKAGDRAVLSQYGSSANNWVYRISGDPVDNGGWFTVPMISESNNGVFILGASIQYETFEQGLTPTPNIEDLDTAETNTSLVLFPDGGGGVQFSAIPPPVVPNIEDLDTAETNTELVLYPDGAGGVSFLALPVFGTEYQYTEDTSEDDTGSTSWQNKLTLTTPSLPAGDYRIEARAEITNDESDKPVQMRVVVDAVAEGTLAYAPKFEDDFISQGDTLNKTFTASVHTIDIDYRTTDEGGDAYIRNARIEIYRVA